MTDKKSCDHRLSQNEFQEWNKPWNFCPCCGQPLQKTALDKVILKAAGLDPAVELFPTQSLWDAAEVLKQAKFRRDRDCLSIDLEIFPDSNREVFMLGVSGLWWAQSRQELKETTLAKALLWTLTQLTSDDIEKLFGKKETA